MANSAEFIANMALGLINDRQISNLNDTNDDNAILCKLYYETAFDEMLMRIKPDCSRAETTLAQDTFTANDYQLAYRYSLPENPFCLKVITANGKRFDRSGNKLIGRKLASNDNTMFIEYISRVQNYAALSAPVVRAMAYNLAMYIAVAKQLSDARQDRLMTQMERFVIPAALGQEGEMDGSQEDISHDGTWTQGGFVVDRDLDATYTYD